MSRSGRVHESVVKTEWKYLLNIDLLCHQLSDEHEFHLVVLPLELIIFLK